MTDTEMLRLLQMFFDGNVLHVNDVIRSTGLPPSEAEKVLEAIRRLRDMKL
jgi:hypothetical protein